MVDTGLLFSNVLTLLLMLVPGFILRKAGVVGDKAPKVLADVVLYVLQPAMLVYAFIRPFDQSVLKNAAWILGLTFLSHTLFSLLSLLFFKKAPENLRRVYRFGTVFSNAGYMGIPLINALFGNEASIYAAVYVIGFSFFSWSVGCLIYTSDKKYVSPKKIFLNPSTIPTYIGLIIFLLSLSGFIPTVITECVSYFSSAVPPVSMLLVGIRLADINLKNAFNKYLPLALVLRLVAFPAAVLAIMKLLCLTGILDGGIVVAVTAICSATPTATMTSMLAEKFDCDAKASGVLVSLSTLLSVVTMPFIGFLANL